MGVGQTFVDSGLTVTTSGGLGGVEAKPIDIMRRGKKKTEELNKELDSSEEYTKEIKADEYMKGRVDRPYDEREDKIYKTYFDDLKKAPSINATLASVGNAYGMGGELAKSVSEHGLGMTKPYVTALNTLIGKQSKHYDEISQKLQKQKNELRSKKYSQSEVNELLRFQIRDVEIEKNKLEAMRQDIQTIEKSLDIIRADYEEIRNKMDKALGELDNSKKSEVQ